MIHDLVISGGTIIDGGGAPGVCADIVIDNGVIAASGACVRPMHCDKTSG